MHTRSTPKFIPDLLAQAAALRPDGYALDFMGRRFSYRDLAGRVERVACALQGFGVAAGDRVCLCLPNTPYFVILYFAVLRAGGVVVAMNPLYVEREMVHLIKDSGAKIVAVPDDKEIHRKVAAAALATGVERIVVCPIGEVLPWPKRLAYRVLARRSTIRVPRDARHIAFHELERGRGSLTVVPRDPEDVAVLQYTGGTTGIPKGATLSHRNLVANALQMRTHDQTCPDEPERVMGVLPMFHVFALTSVLNYSVLTAAEIVLLPRFEIETFLKSMARTRPHRLFAVPTLIGKLNEVSANAKLAGFDRLRCCVSGGAPLPVEILTRFEERTGVRVREGYGLSEASPIIACNLMTGETRVGSVGKAFPDTTIEIRSLNDPFSRAVSGEAGEVCVSGPQVMQGYWGRPQETAEVFVDGFLRTGDVGRFDADGFLFLIDRIKDVILCGGYNVYPRVIEDALYEHAAVEEAVVVGVPDSYRGEAPKAFVKLREGTHAEVDGLRTFLQSRLNKIEMPREIEIRKELPKTLIGKLSKKELREVRGAP
jgi:long-chain acyl-CoA synthetase